MAERSGAAEVEIVPCPDGPILVRGRVTIAGATGPSVDRGRRTVALCRCGLSQRKPFCDGTHRITGFRTDDERADEHPGQGAGEPADATPATAPPR